ncbi:MAG: anthranilate phosphoribosyltransferase [Legionellaceae bacterium]|nr:anthranilate phosphoribosyltransferase [Legionellaceae bacterium]
MTPLNQIYEQLIAKKDLSASQMRGLMQELMTGQLSDCQIASFLVLMRAKEPSVDELTTAAMVMREHTRLIDLGKDILDLVGTGGDGLNTFNISTFASFVAAGAGVQIAKHGNRSVSSSSGSSNLLDAAGISLSADIPTLQAQLNGSGICFLFAPLFHPALRHAATARRELGIRTFFNLLGPLLNPAQAKRQVIGVFSKRWLTPVSQVLENLGSTRHLVVHAADGMDELSVQTSTDIVEFQKGKRHHWQLHPEDYGILYPSLEEIQADSPEESLSIGLQVLAGTPGCAHDIVCLNAAAAIYCSQDALPFAQAFEQARHSIASGQALKAFHLLQQLSVKGAVR